MTESVPASRVCRVVVISVLRFLPAFLEMLLPVLRPRAAEVIDIPIVDERRLRGSAVGPVDDRALHAALDEREAGLLIVRRRDPFPWRDRVERTRERLGIVEGGIDSDRLAVRARPEHLDRFHLVAELEHRV